MQIIEIHVNSRTTVNDTTRQEGDNTRNDIFTCASDSSFRPPTSGDSIGGFESTVGSPNRDGAGSFTNEGAFWIQVNSTITFYLIYKDNEDITYLCL